MPDEFYVDKTLLTSHKISLFSLLAMSAKIIKFFIKLSLRLALTSHLLSNGPMIVIKTQRFHRGGSAGHKVIRKVAPTLFEFDLKQISNYANHGAVVLPQVNPQDKNIFETRNTRKINIFQTNTSIREKKKKETDATCLPAEETMGRMRPPRSARPRQLLRTVN